MALLAWWPMGHPRDAAGRNGLNMITHGEPVASPGSLGESSGSTFFSGNVAAPVWYHRNPGTSTFLDFTDNFSFSAKVKPTNYQPNGFFGLRNGIIGKGSGSTVNWAMQLKDATTVEFIKRTGSEALQFRTFTGIPTMTDRWTTLTMTITGGYVNLYVNGVFFRELAVANIAPQANDPFHIGSITSGSSVADTVFIGYIDDVRVYDHVLSAQEVLTVHQSGEAPATAFFA